MKTNQQICEHFAALLSYPCTDTARRTDEIVELLTADHPRAAADLGPFHTLAGKSALSGLEELYTATFDLRPSCCPYLGYHLCGEGYQRSRFLVGLQQEYRRHGFVPDSAEMADHFAEVLRFLSVLDDEKASRELVEDGLLPAVEKGLSEIEEDQPYGAVLRALLAWLTPADTARPDPGSVEQEEKVS